jgi:hypothetical protein
MCLAAATLAIAAAQAVSKYNAESDAADDQEKQNANTREALQRQRDGERMDAERAQQRAHEEAAAQTNEHSMAAYKELAAFDAIAGENGGGVTSQRASAAMGIREGQDLATISGNAQKRQVELGFSDFASQNRQKTALAAIPSVRRPSLLEAGLTIAGSGVKAYSDTQKITAMTGKISS